MGKKQSVGRPKLLKNGVVSSVFFERQVFEVMKKAVSDGYFSSLSDLVRIGVFLAITERCGEGYLRTAYPSDDKTPFLFDEVPKV